MLLLPGDTELLAQEVSPGGGAAPQSDIDSFEGDGPGDASVDAHPPDEDDASSGPAARPGPRTVSPRAAKKRPATRKRVKRIKGSRRPRDKKWDGTKALNRFKGDPIIKSQYRLNGKQLEVDPD